jgi:hypothetical protein
VAFKDFNACKLSVGIKSLPSPTWNNVFILMVSCSFRVCYLMAINFVRRTLSARAVPPGRRRVEFSLSILSIVSTVSPMDHTPLAPEGT